MTTAGDPIVAEIRQDNDLRQSVRLSSIMGWDCVGYLTDEQRNNTIDSVIRVPLDCSNGASGMSLISVDRLKGTATISFRLSNGTIGSAEIG